MELEPNREEHETKCFERKPQAVVHEDSKPKQETEAYTDVQFP